MNGIKKAALFLSGLDYTEVDQLLSRLDGESARMIRREIMSLRNHDISAEASQQLDEEFLHTAGWEPPQRYREHQFATPKSTSGAGTYAPPQRPNSQYGTVQYGSIKYGAEAFATPVRSFDFMLNWSVNDIIAAIVDEYPQTITTVLAHLPQSKMKAVLSAMPPELQRDIKRRLETYEMPDEQVVQEIESALKVRYRKQLRPARHSTLLESFDDVAMLSDSQLSALFHSVDLTTAMLSLIGADPALIARITKHFSPMEEHEMRKRLKYLNSVDDEEIERARLKILGQYNAIPGF